MIQSRANPDVYEAMDQFRQRCLLDRLSISLPDSDPNVAKVWTVASARELIEDFIEKPNEGKQSFLEKLTLQLSDSSRESVQLLTELTWLYAVISKPYKPSTKRGLIADIAKIQGAATPSGIFDKALEEGLVSTGTSYGTRRPNQLWLLIRFADAWLRMTRADNERLLNDPWAFREFVFELEGLADQTQRHALLHLIHPDAFEDTVSQYHKRDMVAALAPGQTFDNDDLGLAAVRKALTPKYGEGFWLYGDEVRPLWDPQDTNEKSVPDSSAVEEEAEPPADSTIERRAWLIRGSGGERVPEWLRRGLCAVYFEDSFPFEIEPGVSREKLRGLAEEAGIDITAGGFNNELGQVWRFVNDVEVGDYVVTVNGQNIYFGVVNSRPKSVGGRARRETYREVEWANADHPVLRSNVPPAVYSKLKTLLTLSNITSVVEHLELWMSGTLPLESSEATAPADAVRLPVPDSNLAKKLLLPEAWLAQTVELLDEKKQLVLYGPPGTGKTYLAQALADHLTSDGGDSELVQFHPSYAYEDFFEGFRPAQGVAGTVNFELKPGPLRRIAELAAGDPGKPYVLIIDEINRANLAKVFGELYFLLEYRGRSITLQYSDDEFSLPENLYVIGTMNTADRSIAFVDAAMRRRFYFVGMAPDREPVNGLLARWLTEQKIDGELAAILDELNRRIADPDAAIGPSYLMTKAASDPDRLARIWEHAILPLLQERFYGTSDADLKRFQLDSVLKAVRDEDSTVEAIDG